MEIISNNKTATNTVEVEFKASAEEFEQAVQAAYLKKKKMFPASERVRHPVR